MRLSPIVEQLKTSGFPHVYGALEFAGLDKKPSRLPALFVVPDGETATANTTTGIHHQRVTGGFIVVLVMAAAARREDAISEQLDEEAGKIVQALTGWTHPDASRACDYAGGKMLSVDGSTLSWGVRFTTAWNLRKA